MGSRLRFIWGRVIKITQLPRLHRFERYFPNGFALVHALLYVTYLPLVWIFGGYAALQALQVDTCR